MSANRRIAHSSESKQPTDRSPTPLESSYIPSSLTDPSDEVRQIDQGRPGRQIIHANEYIAARQAQHLEALDSNKPLQKLSEFKPRNRVTSKISKESKSRVKSSPKKRRDHGKQKVKETWRDRRHTEYISSEPYDYPSDLELQPIDYESYEVNTPLKRQIPRTDKSNDDGNTIDTHILAPYIP
jgi:hypothetical protein